MAGEKERVDGYLQTIHRLEPDIHPVDASAFYASASISLKRLADTTSKIYMGLRLFMAVQVALVWLFIAYLASR